MGAAKGAINYVRRMNILYWGIGAHTATKAFNRADALFHAQYSTEKVSAVDSFSVLLSGTGSSCHLFPCRQFASSSCHKCLESLGLSDPPFSYFDFFSLGRLADELRVEQEHGISASKAAKSLHGQAPLQLERSFIIASELLSLAWTKSATANWAFQCHSPEGRGAMYSI